MRKVVELPLTHVELYRQIGIEPPRGVLMYGPPGCGKTMLAKAVAHHTTVLLETTLEIREAVELPLTHVELYRQIGIEPPRGVLMYGPPGCGKTMLAKAVAHYTTALSKTALEIREAVELPLTHVELYRQIGIEPPRGVLMYGPPGCGKTMLAKAVAHHTTESILDSRVLGLFATATLNSVLFEATVEMSEAVELPLTHVELYRQIGIEPPRGVLMYDPPGCGKTMLAKAVAHHTTESILDSRVLGLFATATLNSVLFEATVEMSEAVELPLTHVELYRQIGIEPPRGVLMYGPPGCGKTMLAKAVAHHTTGIYRSLSHVELYRQIGIEPPRGVLMYGPPGCGKTMLAKAVAHHTTVLEIREAVELPLTHVELYRQIGIEPPRGVLMYGPPGCGKTMLAKAVAHHTTAVKIKEAVELPLTHVELYRQIGIEPPRGVLMYGPPGCGKTMLAKAVAHHTTEIREAVELPLTHVELYRQIGIEPPRGVLMYGPPGCGKTMLAKAVAHHTTAVKIKEAVELPLTHVELYRQIGIEPPRGVLMYGPPGCGKTMLAKAVAHHTTEIREAVELPLTHVELYRQIGIEPPRGVLMYGPPGCGKTMLAKAVAHHTAAFIRVVGSEFVQKYLGEGPRMVRDVFRLAKENSPAIIFIDEIDAIATKRVGQKYLGEGPRMVRDVFRLAKENSPAIIFIDEIDAIATKRHQTVRECSVGQKYLGEGPRMVRDVFRLAKENSPAIIFIDEIDAIATKRLAKENSPAIIFIDEIDAIATKRHQTVRECSVGQKYLGEGPRMVRDVFRLAKENSPAIIFIDEIDAIATKRLAKENSPAIIFIDEIDAIATKRVGQKYLGEGPRMVRDVFRLAKENSPAIIFIDEIDAIATKRHQTVRECSVGQKYLGEGPRMVRDVFRLAKENSPAIIFIDEIDAIATKRVGQKYLGEGPRMVRDVFRLAKENSPAIIFIDEIDAIATKRVGQKYLGEGPRMVRDVFRLAKENSPAIIFIDEIDAIATKRFDAQTGADREVQRILLELLNQMDGFDQTTNVKVIMATNRADTLDPALLRPGRLDRKIEFPLPDRRQKRLIFSTITAKMNLSEEVDLEEFVARPDRVSGADINAICQEAGMHAVRENRYIVLPKDFEKGYKNNIKKDESEYEFYK
ncbi:ATPase family associated with various cellular activities (AAA) domain-containing protein [Phthorimaea operculella]|nr:ATPase family associated with various cellular activities (AAA) domain-containing protein [Phthorimaea operculella]